jgi:hypothetical protein
MHPLEEAGLDADQQVLADVILKNRSTLQNGLLVRVLD